MTTLLLLFAGMIPAFADDHLSERIEAIERLHVERPWQESQQAIEALRADGLARASAEQFARLDLMEGRNLILAGRFDEAMERLDRVLSRPVSIDQRLRALELAANTAGIDKRYALAFNYLYEGLKLLPQARDPGPRAGLLVLAARFHSLAGERALALEYIAEALAAARESGDDRTICFAEQDLVFQQIRAGLSSIASDSADTMWQSCQESADPVLQGAGMMAMGAALLENGRYDEAAGWLERAIEMHRANDFELGVVESRFYLGRAMLGLGRAEAGTDLLLDSVEYFETREDWRPLIELHAALAESFEARDLPGRALDHLRAQYQADTRFNDIQRTLRVAYQQAEFENQRQQQELRMLRQRNELFELERQTQASREKARAVAGIMAAVIGILLIGLLIRFRADRKRFRRLSERDGLTGLLNHSRFHRTAGVALERARQNDQPCTLIAADVDLFKQVNDRYGHPAGDAVLVYLGQLLRDVFPPPGIVGRVGGEEFAVFLPGQNRLQARQRVETLRRRIRPVEVDGESIAVTMSFGLAEARRERRLERLRLRADDALYRAKRSGRDELIDAAELPDGEDV